MTGYEKHLEELLKQYDLLPWLELTQATLPLNASGGSFIGGAWVGGSVATFQTTEPYAYVFDKMPFLFWDYYKTQLGGSGPFYTSLNDLSVGSGLYQWQTGGNVSQLTQQQNMSAVEDVLGSFNDKWNAIPYGARIREFLLWQAQFQYSNPNYNGGALLGMGLLYTGLRGYRTYPKGSISPPQRTRREHLASGLFEPRAYTYSGQVQVTVGQLTPNPASYQQIFGAPQELDADFLCHRFRIRPQAPGIHTPGAEGGAALFNNLIPAIFVGLQPQGSPSAAFQGGSFKGSPLQLFPWQMAMGVDFSLYNFGQTQAPPASPPFAPVPRLDTQWYLPHPLTIKNQQQWNCLAQPLNPIAGTNPDTNVSGTVIMEFIFEGELLIPKSEAGKYDAAVERGEIHPHARGNGHKNRERIVRPTAHETRHITRRRQRR